MVDVNDAAGAQHSRTVIKNLNKGNAKLRERIRKLESDIGWHKQYTFSDGGTTSPRNIGNIIKERDEAQARLSNFYKMVDLFLSKWAGAPAHQLRQFVEAMRGVANVERESDLHIVRLTAFLHQVYDLEIERRFYEAVSGGPLTWIPVRTEVINDIVARIRIFGESYEFGQHVWNWNDLRHKLLSSKHGNTVEEQV